METCRPTQLSQEAFEELREIARAEIADPMTDPEIQEMGVNLLQIFKLLTRRPLEKNRPPLTEQESTALAFIRHEQDHGRTPSTRSLARTMGFRSSRSGHRMIETLVSKGYVTRG